MVFKGQLLFSCFLLLSHLKVSRLVRPTANAVNWSSATMDVWDFGLEISAIQLRCSVQTSIVQYRCNNNQTAESQNWFTRPSALRCFVPAEWTGNSKIKTSIKHALWMRRLGCYGHIKTPPPRTLNHSWYLSTKMYLWKQSSINVLDVHNTQYNETLLQQHNPPCRHSGQHPSSRATARVPGRQVGHERM